MYQASSSDQMSIMSDSQSTLNNVQVWRRHQGTDSRSLTNMPPAYRDTRRSQASSAFRTPDALLDGQTTNADPLDRSTTESEVRRFRPPPRSSSISRSEDTSSISSSAIPDTSPSAPLTSHSSLRRRPSGGMSDIPSVGFCRNIDRENLVSVSTTNSSEPPRMPPIDEARQVSPNAEYRPATLGRNRSQGPNRSTRRRMASIASSTMSDTQSVKSDGQRSAPSIPGMTGFPLNLKQVCGLNTHYGLIPVRAIECRAISWCS
jgi:hypothetical protein